MPSPEISIIIVSYNTREMTLDCLRSVIRETETPFELIVIDNDSTDGSAAAIATEFPEITLMAETANHGFAKANNIAAEAATAPYILLLNPDTVVLDRAIDRLYEFARAKPEAKIWGGRTYFGDMSLNATSCWRKMSLWSIFCRTSGLTGAFPGSDFFNPEAYGGWQRDRVRAVDIVTGCFLMLPRPIWEALGGFDLVYQMYGEEADLCLRATNEHGAQPHITPDASIIHYGGASETVRADKMVRVLRAKAELISQHFKNPARGLGLWLFGLWPVSRVLAYQLAGMRRGSVSHRDKIQLWREINRRKSEWINGFTSKD
jgi:GT2 family glycosyltransferase